MAADPEIDVVVELIGGADGIARQVLDTALDHGKHVVTANKALMAHDGTRLAARAEEKGRHPRLRGRGRRRHPGHQGAARGSRRQPARARLRHSQRHLELHPDDDARERARVRRGAGRGAKARLCRGRSELRHRRHRRRAQAGDPGERRVRPPGRPRRGLHRGDPPRLAARHRLRRGARLPHQAARHRAADRGRARAARPSLHGAAGDADRGGRGRLQRRRRRGRFRRPGRAGRARRRRLADGLGGRRRSRRHRRRAPRRRRSGSRPPICARSPGCRSSGTRAPTTSG